MTLERFMAWLKKFQAELNDEFTNGPAKDLTKRPAFYTLRRPEFVYTPEGDYWLIDEDGNTTDPIEEFNQLIKEYPHEILYLASNGEYGLSMECLMSRHREMTDCGCNYPRLESIEEAKRLEAHSPESFRNGLDLVFVKDWLEWDWWRARHGLIPPCMERGDIEDVELTHAFFLTRKSAERHIQRYYHDDGKTRCSGANNIWHNPDLQRLVVFMACLDLDKSTLVIDENRLTRLAEN